MEDSNLDIKDTKKVLDDTEAKITHESPKLRGVYSEFMEQIEAREEEAKEEEKEAPLGKAKTSFKINIVDISHKKEPHSKVKFLKDRVESFEKREGKMLFDSLIYLGGGLLAFTSITSKNLSNLGTFLINKK